MRKILVIGNSHSNDTFWQLHEVFKAQAPEEDVVLGLIYYSGCRISQHIRFAQNNENVYIYYRNTDGKWEEFRDVPMQTGLLDQQWDTVLIQPGRPAEEYEKQTRDTLAQIVAGYVKTPYRLMWHQSWPAPNDETFYSPTYDPQPPATYRERLTQMFGFDTVNQLRITCGRVKQQVLGDAMFDGFISTGAAIMHAQLVSGVPQTQIYRDYTHLSDYGRLIAAYAFYAQITGDSVTQVKVDTIAANLRHRRARVLGDMTVTEEMKQVIVAAVKHAQEDPWSIPGEN